MSVEHPLRIPPPLFIDGLATVPAARAVIDTCRQLDRLDDVRSVVAAAGQQRRTTVPRLADELAAGPRSGSALPRAVLAEVAAGVRSVAEAGNRQLIMTGRVLPEPL